MSVPMLDHALTALRSAPLYQAAGSHLERCRLPVVHAKALLKGTREGSPDERRQRRALRSALDMALDEADARGDDQVVLLADDRTHALDLLAKGRAA